MRVVPKNALLQQSSEEIKKQISHLLLAAGVKDKLPTPKEDVVACAKLVEIGEIELSEYKESWIKKGGDFFRRAFSKVKGLLDFREKIIFINPDIHYSKKTFVTYHEVTHRVLPWHKGLYNPHIDTDYSLDSRIATELEAEANLGASLIQFQIDRFAKELKDLPTGLGSALHLSRIYETSLHSTFRKYVEDNHKSCALLVLKALDNEISNNQQILQLWYPLQSHKFTKEFGPLDWGKSYCPGNPIYDTVLSDSLESVKTGEIILEDLLGFKKKCKVEAFCNTFNHFILIYPAPRLPSRTKIIIANN
ncbi:MAG: hypothetical protein ACE5KK_02660 [Candidatus Brocadiales bacterium]